jgi:DNA-binding CsgD family transcriptional regulator
MEDLEEDHQQQPGQLQAPTAFSVLCDVPVIAKTLTGILERQGFRSDPAASLVIVLDSPCGFLPFTLARLEAPPSSLIAVTWSFCPEYWEDLWDLRPDVLVVADGFEIDMAHVMGLAAKGARYRITPDTPSLLTPAERRLLRLIAYGQSNSQIAEQISMQQQTVKNTLTTTYKKLGLRNRTEAVLYYWGVWHVFARRTHATQARYPRRMN